MSVPRTDGSKAMTDRTGRSWSRGDKIALCSLIVTLAGVIVASPKLNDMLNLGLFEKSTPRATLTTFCESLRDEDYRTAYSQNSQRMQAEYVRDGGLKAVAAGWRSNNGHGVITGCSVQGTDNDGSLSTNSVLYTYADRTQTRFYYGLVMENGEWKIDQWSVP